MMEVVIIMIKLLIGKQNNNGSYNLLSTYYLPGTVFHASSNLIFPRAPMAVILCTSPFLEEMEALKCFLITSQG